MKISKYPKTEVLEDEDVLIISKPQSNANVTKAITARNLARNIGENVAQDIKDEILAAVGEVLYPVGSIYISVNNTDPTTLFGGTWERLENRFLLAAGSSYAAGATGGASEVTLSAAIGCVNGNAHGLGYIQEGPSAYQSSHGATYATGGSAITYSYWNHSTPVTEMGKNQRNTSIMPPYLAVYMWKRTA